MLREAKKQCYTDPYQCICRCRQAKETMSLTCVEIEFCKTVGCKQRYKQCKVFQPKDVGQLDESHIEKHARCHAAGDYVGQGVEFLAERGCHAKETCSKSVEEVEENAEADEEGSQVQCLLKTVYTRKHSAKKVAECYNIRNLSFNHYQSFTISLNSSSSQ